MRFISTSAITFDVTQVFLYVTSSLSDFDVHCVLQTSHYYYIAISKVSFLAPLLFNCLSCSKVPQRQSTTTCRSIIFFRCITTCEMCFCSKNVLICAMITAVIWEMSDFSFFLIPGVLLNPLDEDTVEHICFSCGLFLIFERSWNMWFARTYWTQDFRAQ